MCSSYEFYSVTQVAQAGMDRQIHCIREFKDCQMVRALTLEWQECGLESQLDLLFSRLFGICILHWCREQDSVQAESCIVYYVAIYNDARAMTRILKC